MSLDVYLISKEAKQVDLGPHIFIRENGSTIKISLEEWNKRFPDREPNTFSFSGTTNAEVYSANITHNLWKMADEAGIYKHLWRPEELNITLASQLVIPLQAGLYLLNKEPERFKKLNPENGWGTYEELVKFVAYYLAACIENPDATIGISR